MTGYTHMAFGAAVSFAVLSNNIYHNTGASGTIGLVVASMLGAAIPDIDQMSKKIIRRVLALSFLLFLISLYAGNTLYMGLISGAAPRVSFTNPSWVLSGGVLYIILFIFGSLSRHRTFTHSIFALFLFSYSIFLIYSSVYIWFFIGFLSHLFLDLFNYTGEQLFWPFKLFPSLKLCSASGKCSFVILVLSLVYITYLHTPFFLTLINLGSQRVSDFISFLI